MRSFSHRTFVPLLSVLIILGAGLLSCSVWRRTASSPAIKPIPRWMELPVIPKEKRGQFYTRDTEIDSVRIRSWSNLYDTTSRLSSWVAYPLNKALMGGNIRRSNTWGLDPQVSATGQQSLFRGYSDGNNGRYSRGHQIASADRLYSLESNSTTFYFTNMTPQRGDFNGGIWNNLEIQVRDWARRCDTLYVVTGCLYGDSDAYALDNEGRKVPSPTAYYKALLAYKADGSIGVHGYTGLGVILDHYAQYDGGKLEDWMFISLDELQGKTGEKFFPLLSKVLGKKDAGKVFSASPLEERFWKRSK